MSGTTLCPHCDTRFKIAEEQLEAHRGMVRCGHCLQAFDARPGYIPDEPSPQLELPILEDQITSDGVLPADAPPAAETDQETPTPKIPCDDLLDFNRPASAEPVEEAPPHAAEPGEETPPHAVKAPVALTLAEQVVIVQDEESDQQAIPAHRRWPMAIAASLLLLALLAQGAYFFRVDLAARLPALKPALVSYCLLLACSVPLPQKAELMSIDSSDLEANPEYENQITLNALLRNRASYTQAYPNLELTLNDAQDTPLARRTFKPKDYLPPPGNQQAGLLPNHELSVKLHLHTADLRPFGYRLALFYPQP